MLRMRRGRCDARIARRRRHSEMRKRRIVEAVNEVMGDARMIGLFREHLVEDGRGSFLAGKFGSLSSVPTAVWESA